MVTFNSFYTSIQYNIIIIILIIIIVAVVLTKLIKIIAVNNNSVHSVVLNSIAHVKIYTYR